MSNLPWPKSVGVWCQGGEPQILMLVVLAQAQTLENNAALPKAERWMAFFSHRERIPTASCTMKVIARTSHFCTGIVGFLLGPVILRPVIMPSIAGLLWATLAIGVIVRVSTIQLSVSRECVRIQNFFRTTDIPIWEAEVEQGEPEPELGYIELREGQEAQAGRMLYIRRPWHGDRVHVLVAPRFGTEAERIHSELLAEIAEARAA